MDTLTRRLMASAGIDPTAPLLPPVHNIRMVRLKEELSDADILLHNARIAVKDLEDARNAPLPAAQIQVRTEALYDRMALLEKREQDYFARRYIGHDKAVLKGWLVDRKQRIFNRLVADLSTGANARVRQFNTIPNQANFVKQANIASAGACATARQMNERWYPRGRTHLPRSLNPPDFGDLQERLNGYVTQTRNIEHQYREVATDQQRVLVQDALRNAKKAQRFAQLITNNTRDIPNDL